MCSLEEVAAAYPLLDVVDHDNRKKLVVAITVFIIYFLLIALFNINHFLFLFGSDW